MSQSPYGFPGGNLRYTCAEESLLCTATQRRRGRASILYVSERVTYGDLLYVEPDIFFEAVFNEVLICKQKVSVSPRIIGYASVLAFNLILSPKAQ